jgi:hypothetical protein
MKTGKTIFLLLLPLIFGWASPVRPAENVEQAVYRILRLPKDALAGPCWPSNIRMDASGKKELFRLEYCPVCRPGNLIVAQKQGRTDAGKGKMTYDFECEIKRTSYYVGKVRNESTLKSIGQVKADYLYALGDLSLKNITVEGPQECTDLLVKHIRNRTKAQYR